MTDTEWTELHAAARIACGTIGSVSNDFEKLVRDAWEWIDDIDDVKERDPAASAFVPDSTYGRWSIAAGSQAVRERVDELIEGHGDGFVKSAGMFNLLGYAIHDVLLDALHAMPGAFEVSRRIDAEVRAAGDAARGEGGAS